MPSSTAARDELLFALATAPGLWSALRLARTDGACERSETCVLPEHRGFVDRQQGRPFTMDRLPSDGLGLDVDLVNLFHRRASVAAMDACQWSQGYTAVLRRWAVRWGGTYNATSGRLTGCALDFAPSDWRSFVA